MRNGLPIEYLVLFFPRENPSGEKSMQHFTRKLLNLRGNFPTFEYWCGANDSPVRYVPFNYFNPLFLLFYRTNLTTTTIIVYTVPSRTTGFRFFFTIFCLFSLLPRFFSPFVVFFFSSNKKLVE